MYYLALTKRAYQRLLKVKASSLKHRYSNSIVWSLQTMKASSSTTRCRILRTLRRRLSSIGIITMSKSMMIFAESIALMTHLMKKIRQSWQLTANSHSSSMSQRRFLWAIEASQTTIVSALRPSLDVPSIHRSWPDPRVHGASPSLSLPTTSLTMTPSLANASIGTGDAARLRRW